MIVGVRPGLGRSIARTFAQAGYPVAMQARDQAKLDGYGAEIAPGRRDVRGYAADAADPGGCGPRCAPRSPSWAPDVLVYNIAVVRKDAPVGGDDADWADVLAVNVLGGRVAADTVLPELRGGRGSLLFTGGGFALRPTGSTRP